MTNTNHSTETATKQADMQEKSTLSPDKRDLVIERVFDAPRELLFKVWTDQEHVAKWWGPKWFTNPVCELDPRPGGAINIHMADPEGNLYPMSGVFTEIVEPERLVMVTTAIADANGDPLLETTATVTFAEHQGKTKLTLHVQVTKAEPGTEFALGGMEEGWNQSLDKLADYL